MKPKDEPKRTTSSADVISWITALMIFLIASGSFVLSYSNLRQTAAAHGVAGNLSYIWPLLVDFALVVFSLAVVRASLYNERTWWPWTLVALYTTATVAFNILHAPANLTAQIVAVVAPLSLFLSFETLMAMLKSEVVRRGVALSLAAMSQELERIRVQVGLATDELDQTKVELIQAGSSLADALLKSQAAKEENSRVSEEAARKAQEVSDLEVRAGELLAQVERLTVQKSELKAELKRDEPKRVEPVKVSADARQAPGNNPELSERQRQILDLVGRGLTQEAVAGELGVHVSTVKRELVKLNGLAEGVRL